MTDRTKRARAAEQDAIQPLDGEQVTTAALLRMAERTTEKTFHIAAPALSPRDPVVVGRMNNMRCRSGLHVHATDATEAHDLNTEWIVPPCIKVALILEGALDVDIGERRIHLGGGDGPTGLIWSMTRRTKIVRRSRQGTRIRKVMITVPRDWLRGGSSETGLPGGVGGEALTRFAARNGAARDWLPSKHAIAIAERILNPEPAPATLQQLSAESQAIDIVHEALGSLLLGRDEAPRHPVSPRMRGRAQTIQRFLVANLENLPPLSVMAQRLGMSVASMQEAFKSGYGVTIAAYARGLRLHKARRAIEQDGLTVGEAAYLAGYTNPANFATAFKRAFGVSPSNVRG